MPATGSNIANEVLLHVLVQRAIKRVARSGRRAALAESESKADHRSLSAGVLRIMPP